MLTGAFTILERSWAYPKARTADILRLTGRSKSVECKALEKFKADAYSSYARV